MSDIFTEIFNPRNHEHTPPSLLAYIDSMRLSRDEFKSFKAGPHDSSGEWVEPSLELGLHNDIHIGVKPPQPPWYFSKTFELTITLLNGAEAIKVIELVKSFRG